MKENKSKDLIEKYLNGTATEQEKAILNSWYSNRSRAMADEMPEPDYELWDRKISSQLPKPGKTISGWFKYSVAAAVMILVGTGIFFYKQYDKKRDQNVITAAMDIAPGKKSATLTLANGKKIRLSDVNNGSLAKEAGVTISKTKEGELVYEIEDTDIESNPLNTLTTAKGETYKIRLPDGSLVWLNAASSLIYPASLNKNGVRRVELKGEGYFEIAKDKKHPFVVKTSQQEVTVLGTHFNISAYPEEAVTLTTLLEGSVKVANSKDQKILVPNQQSATSGNSFSVKTVETDDVIAWKNGLFVFNDESLENIMREVCRWYDIEVIYRNADKNKLFFGGISRYDHLSGILKKLELTEGVHFKLEGRRIIVSK
ncbi:anti-sigma factor [Pedobacter sp. HMWF019]|uniref:FecR family protein n=1 Tax=Pedobacter sp. HMWF019 TaxID=2056856 RepID=UPI000D3D201D|nr:FecR family protein [Pedobacter sp. HMWF019]PTS97168.1 anti-sigma factor [Pedobacter sp. HMWF019]